MGFGGNRFLHVIHLFLGTSGWVDIHTDGNDSMARWTSHYLINLNKELISLQLVTAFRLDFFNSLSIGFFFLSIRW